MWLSLPRVDIGIFFVARLAAFTSYINSFVTAYSFPPAVVRSVIHGFSVGTASVAPVMGFTAMMPFPSTATKRRPPGIG